MLDGFLNNILLDMRELQEPHESCGMLTRLQVHLKSQRRLGSRQAWFQSAENCITISARWATQMLQLPKAEHDKEMANMELRRK